MRYYVQHGAGLGDLVVTAMRVDLHNADLQYQDDSSLVFEADGVAPDRVAALPYLKNTFQILSSSPRGAMPGSVDQLVKFARKRKVLVGQKRGVPFRTMVNVDGQLIGLPPQTRTQLETMIGEQTGGRLNSRGGTGVEFWVIGRRDMDLLLFCKRLSVGGKKAGPKGALSADLATLLVKASSPHKDDVFLDPFAGSGAIVTARLDMPLRKAVYSDLNLAEHRQDLPRRLSQSRQVDVLDEDALRLPSIPDGSVSAIVTDPPWGEYEQMDESYESFSRAMIDSFDRVLHPTRGRLVLLLGRRVAYTTLNVLNDSALRVDDVHDILVNGHPASVLVAGR